MQDCRVYGIFRRTGETWHCGSQRVGLKYAESEAAAQMFYDEVRIYQLPCNDLNDPNIVHFAIRRVAAIEDLALDIDERIMANVIHALREWLEPMVFHLGDCSCVLCRANMVLSGLEEMQRDESTEAANGASQ